MILLKIAYLFNQCNCNHLRLEVVHLFLCFMAVIHSLKCTVSFSFVVLLAVVWCLSLSFVVTCYHSLSLVVIFCHLLCNSLSLVAIRCATRCYSLFQSLSFNVTLFHSMPVVVPFVITQCTTCLSFYKQTLFIIILQE